MFLVAAVASSLILVIANPPLILLVASAKPPAQEIFFSLTIVEGPGIGVTDVVITTYQVPVPNTVPPQFKTVKVISRVVTGAQVRGVIGTSPLTIISGTASMDFTGTFLETTQNIFGLFESLRSAEGAFTVTLDNNGGTLQLKIFREGMNQPTPGIFTRTGQVTGDGQVRLGGELVDVKVRGAEGTVVDPSEVGYTIIHGVLIID